ncbi:4-hydroxybenzoate polyprenyltransferase, mitochondrial-like isoform X2 [Babylonia areolata]|uniref:4-hydroxybenzoate polyprenyltransferase, mitochondrial-like isoform X2 n=1 Tax=Babylonia areolata TaxID=304850 RepID=UPI003FD6A878
MYCRHILLGNMVPSATQRLLGLATTSPLSQSWVAGPSAALPKSSAVTTSVLVPAPHRELLSGPVPHHQPGPPRHWRKTNIHTLTRTIPQLHSCQFSHSLDLHQWKKSGWERCGGQVQQHPLLGTPCLLMGRRGFSALPKAILEASPPSLQPYMRLIRFDKPIGTMLLFWPCTWSIALAAEPGHLPDPWILALFGAGAFFMRGAGCIINDMWDSDFDKKVERTKQRPLASGELTHFQALVFLASQLSISLGILLQLNTYSILLGAASMVLVVLYPLAKRFTYWPQIMLGVTLNWGVLLAWSGLKGSLDCTVAPLYLACVLYTMFYDTIYSHQDKYDDMLIGVKSTALKLGDSTKPWLAGFSSLMIGGLSLTGVMCDQTWPYFVGVAGVAAHLARQLYTVDLNNAEECAAKFRSNSNLGFFLFMCIVAGTLLRTEPDSKAVKDDKEVVQR